ncbi:MAG: efflux RND transporter periplasmic adaptor subunit [Candidatus Omnitrophica bacterium]|nr:efflux RND transporter periplasmic adaptor subunit [Candidatus Omnitrophota bacterium]
MRSKKTHIFVLVIFTFLWAGLIIWGFFKNATQLTSGSKPVVLSQQTENSKNQLSHLYTKVAEKIKSWLGFKQPPKKETASKKDQQPTGLEPPAVLVRAFVVSKRDFKDTLPVMGTVKAQKEIPLKFEVNGVIKKIYFREGERIKKGDLIVELDPKDMEYRLQYAQNKFEATKAAAATAQKKLEVHQKLYEAGAIIKAKFEEVQLEAESAKYQVETARAELELATNEAKKIKIFSPIDGVMGPRDAEEGEFVTPQDKVATVYEISEVNVEVGVVERDIEKVKIGQKANVYVDAYPGVAFPGVVDKIYPVVEGKSRTLTAKIKVLNPTAALLPGMFSRADIEIIELSEAIIVPTTCLVAASKDIILAPVIPASTIRKTEDEAEIGTVMLRQITVGYRTSDYAQIISGLSTTDLVVLEAQGEIKDGSRVKIIGKEELTF